MSNIVKIHVSIGEYMSKYESLHEMMKTGDNTGHTAQNYIIDEIKAHRRLKELKEKLEEGKASVINTTITNPEAKANSFKELVIDYRNAISSASKAMRREIKAVIDIA